MHLWPGSSVSYGLRHGRLYALTLVATRAASGLTRGFSRYRKTTRSLPAAGPSFDHVGAGPVAAQSWMPSSGSVGSSCGAQLARFDFEPRYSYPTTPQVGGDDHVGVPAAGREHSPVARSLPFLNFFDRPGPYESPARYDTLFGRSDRRARQVRPLHRYLRRRVAAALRLPRVRGVMDNTGRHHHVRPWRAVWRARAGWPQQFAVRAADPRPARHPPSGGVRPARACRSMCRFAILPQTLIDLSGLPDARGLGGASLASTWESPTPRECSGRRVEPRGESRSQGAQRGG